MFRAIESEKPFAPFSQLRLTFPPVANKPETMGEVQLFTGINGTGKTRILSLLAGMLGNEEPLKKRLKGFDGQLQFSVSDSYPSPPKGPAWSRFTVHPNNLWFQQTGPFNSSTASLPAFVYSGMAYVTDAQVGVMADIKTPPRQSCLSFNRPEGSSNRCFKLLPI